MTDDQLDGSVEASPEAGKGRDRHQEEQQRTVTMPSDLASTAAAGFHRPRSSIVVRRRIGRRCRRVRYTGIRGSVACVGASIRHAGVGGRHTDT